MVKADSGLISNGELIHFGSVRLQVSGEGELQHYLRSVDNINFEQLENVVMTPVGNRWPTTLSNITEQSIQLELKTVDENDWFYISKIVVFTKLVGTGYPQ